MLLQEKFDAFTNGLLESGAIPRDIVEILFKATSDMAPLAVRVNIVTPGPVITPGGDDVRKTITSEMGIADEQFFATAPLKGRAGAAEELADVIVFLASPRASCVTGHNTFGSGGWGELAL